MLEKSNIIIYTFLAFKHSIDLSSLFLKIDFRLLCMSKMPISTARGVSKMMPGCSEVFMSVALETGKPSRWIPLTDFRTKLDIFL